MPNPDVIQANRRLTHALPAFVCVVLLAAIACDPGKHPSDAGSAKTKAEPSWADELPAVTVESASPDDWFWAAIPDGAGAQISLIRSTDGGATWQDRLRRPVQAHGALVHPFGSPPAEGESTGSPMLLFVAGQGLVAGVCATADGQRSCRIDWNGQTVTQGPETPITALASLSPWRIYGDPAMRGLEIARADGSVWLINGGGQIEKHPESAVRSQDIRPDWQAGDSVAAFDWAHGLRNGKILAAVEAGLRFSVAFEDGTEGVYFFDQLTAPTS